MSIVSNPVLAGDSPLVNTATSTPGMSSILGGSSIVDTGVPTLDTTGNIPSPPAVGTGDAGSGGAAAPSGGSLDIGTILGDLFNAGSGQWFSGLGTYGALAGLGAYQASQAQKTNASTIAPINQIGQPLVDAGTGLLTQAQSGTLTPAQQKVVSTSQTQGQSLIDAATPVGKIAQDMFSQFQSGTLRPADQAQLDAQVAAAKQQLRQSLGPNVDSSMLATYDAQIDNQALMTKQQMLNSYLATGNTEFDQWAQTTQAGQATILQGQQYAVQQIDQTFQQALEASSLGGNDILAGIQLAVQSNTEIAAALQNFYGNLAKAYAMQVAGGAAGRAAGQRGSGATAAQQAAAGLKNIPGLNNLLNFDPSVPSVDANTGIAGAQATGLTDLSSGLGDTGYFGSVPGMTNLSDASGVGYFGTTDMTGGLGSSTAGAGLGADVFGAATDTAATDVASSVATDAAASTLGDVGSSLLGFSTAGGGAAAAGTGAGLTALSAGDIAAGAGGVSDAAVAASLQAGAAMPAADAALGGADAAAGGAGVGVAGSLGLIGLVAAPALYGMSQPPVTYGSGYYSNAASILAQGFNIGQPGFPILNQAMVNPSGLAPGMWSVLGQYGITPQNIQQVYKQASSGSLDQASVGGGAGGVLPV